MSAAKTPIPFLGEALVFPPAGAAGKDGLVAIGGDLEPERLLLAYRSGIFPWFSDDSLILWWSPDPRMVLFPNELRVSRSMRQLRSRKVFRVTKNQCFSRVIAACSQIPRKGEQGTWITPEMQAAYIRLHELGHAVSYEVWQGDELVGGLYGVDLGDVFCGESMFSRVSNASKAGFIHMVRELAAREYRLVDCQVYTSHLESLGAREIPRERFLALLQGEDQVKIDK
ncbi:leucyl/phenylalanyl-tRNA--protein transferase [Robiginitalea sp. SC105]|uniref:leucyl/phenylalanyl-tRNA--protein transferase n=1 Tax=Robiginitalea sp. SC105 TaxID=2762332 RepID=UPI00163A53F4|nr:leucyl/phenylalanyl-tRNA--protein transferase [Robiginitalea sp. SC105]MBC2837934.1 leucyl/phenylalanyl-tRNA--protein transferase [Robiginitalea sp. SC105]